MAWKLFVALLTGVVLLLGTQRADAQTILDKAQRDEVVRIPEGDPDMAAAMRKARASLPEFFALSRTPRASTSAFSVKVGIRTDDQQGHEFFWIRPFENKGNHYSGQLRNTPRGIKRLKHGDTVTFKETEIVDWTYQEDGKTKGNFTACALLKREPKESAAAFMRQYGLSCDP